MAHLHALCSVVLIFGYLSKILTCSAITTKSVEPDGTICPDIEECFEHRLEQIEKRIERRYESTINGLKREVELLKNSEMHNKIGECMIGFIMLTCPCNADPLTTHFLW